MEHPAFDDKENIGKKRDNPYFKDALFILLILTLLLVILVYLLQKNKLLKEESQQNRKIEEVAYDSTIIGMETGVVNFKHPSLNVGRWTFIGEATGEISEEIVKSSKTGETIGKISAVHINTKDGNDSPIVLKIVLQLTSENSDQNSIPWYLKEAYRSKEGKTISNQRISKDELSDLFNNGSKWIFEPLLRSSVSSQVLEESGYLDLAEEYYTEENWESMEDAYNNKYVDLDTDKPILVLTLHYLKPVI